jgi:Mrp family chromosome partitioning ATPase
LTCGVPAGPHFREETGEFNSLPHTLAKADPSLFASLAVPSGVENLDVVLSKASSEISPANLMGSGIIVEFFTWARQNYDRVVIDSPPFGIVGDVMTLASLVDSVMIMCCPDRTRFQPIKHAARTLTESGARVIGVIVNDVDFGRRNHFRPVRTITNRYATATPPATAPTARVKSARPLPLPAPTGVGRASPPPPASRSTAMISRRRRTARGRTTLTSR